jgi:toxin ParE1/3/4
MIVLWTDTALKNLDQLHEYIMQDNPSAATRMARLIRDGVEQLQHFPAMGRMGRVANTRELVVSGTPYIVQYTVQTESVVILGVIHGARAF